MRTHTLSCLHTGWMYIVYACLALPYLAYITVDLNPADWAASVAQLAERWTSNPVVTGSDPVRGSSVFFSLSAFGLCLTCFPSLLTVPCAYTCMRLIICIYTVYVLRVLPALSYLHLHKASANTLCHDKCILPHVFTKMQMCIDTRAYKNAHACIKCTRYMHTCE